MAIRKKTAVRLTLYRTCHTCGKSIITTADTPWMRQIPIDGRQVTCYFCSEACKRASYKHKGYWDGQYASRKAARDAQRAKERNKRYYAAHAEQERLRARERYWADPEAAREDSRYQRKKRNLKKECGECSGRLSS